MPNFAKRGLGALLGMGTMTGAWGRVDEFDNGIPLWYGGFWKLCMRGAGSVGYVDTDGPVEREIPNPRWLEVSDALALARGFAARLSVALDRPYWLFHEDVLVGPAGVDTGLGLAHWWSQMKRDAERAVEELEDELSRTPKTVVKWFW